MKFTPALLDEIRARIPVSQVVGRSVQLKRAGREYKGLSPFKDERTPSFTVNDQKGFYHCFATGEHGDIFTFLMKTEGLAFPEAVKQLAESAGVDLPKPTERSKEREEQRDRLIRLMELSCAFFEKSLQTDQAAHARTYLEKRGLPLEIQRRFRIGYGPDSRTALKERLLASGFTDQEIILSGMAIGGDDIPISYDRFRDRIMFPITDASGRTIAFGGRALSADIPAKYLNSPETPLFHKGSVLFNYKNARRAAFDAGQVVAVEGYMDVIALSTAQFENTVAPLGTALTENQLGLLWRMADEPTLCFDGDAAGQKAAFRALDTALPLLEPGKSLGFAFMPEGQDPDDLLKEQGPGAMKEVLANAQTMIDVLWSREWNKADWSTPERRAKLEQNLFQAAGAIRHDGVRNHYQAALQERFSEIWGDLVNPNMSHSNGAPQHQRPSGVRRSHGAYKATPTIRQQFAGRSSRSLQKSALVESIGQNAAGRECLMLEILLNHPFLIEENAEQIAGLKLKNVDFSALRDALLEAHALEIALDTTAIRDHLTRTGHEHILAQIDSSSHAPSVAFASLDAHASQVRSGWRHTVALHTKSLQLRDELEQASRLLEQEYSERALARVVELSRLLHESEAGDLGLDSVGA